MSHSEYETSKRFDQRFRSNEDEVCIYTNGMWGRTYYSASDMIKRFIQKEKEIYAKHILHEATKFLVMQAEKCKTKEELADCIENYYYMKIK